MALAWALAISCPVHAEHHVVRQSEHPWTIRGHHACCVCNRAWGAGANAAAQCIGSRRLTKAVRTCARAMRNKVQRHTQQHVGRAPVRIVRAACVRAWSVLANAAPKRIGRRGPTRAMGVHARAVRKGLIQQRIGARGERTRCWAKGRCSLKKRVAFVDNSHKWVVSV